MTFHGISQNLKMIHAMKAEFHLMSFSSAMGVSKPPELNIFNLLQLLIFCLENLVQVLIKIKKFLLIVQCRKLNNFNFSFVLITGHF